MPTYDKRELSAKAKEYNVVRDTFEKSAVLRLNRTILYGGEHYSDRNTVVMSVLKVPHAIKEAIAKTIASLE